MYLIQNRSMMKTTAAEQAKRTDLPLARSAVSLAESNGSAWEEIQYAGKARLVPRGPQCATC